MVNVSADGGKGGDGFNGGIGGKGGDGGRVHIIANSITEIATLTNNIQNNITVIIQKFDEAIKEVDEDKTLDSNQKLKIKSILKNLKEILITAEPYVRPHITKVLTSLALSG